MANVCLFISSVVITAIHAISYTFYRTDNILLTMTITLGCATSIWNHGTTSLSAKITDRVAMYIGFASNVYTIHGLDDSLTRYSCISILISSAFMYFSSKFLLNLGYTYLSNVMHSISHILLTYVHVILMKVYGI
jgi:hypothetical protein